MQNLVDYHGQKLVKSEYDAICEIEKGMGAIRMYHHHFLEKGRYDNQKKLFVRKPV